MSKPGFRFRTLLCLTVCAWLFVCGAARAAEEPLLNGYLRDHASGVTLNFWYDGSESDAELVDGAFCAVYGGSGDLLTVRALDPTGGMQSVVIPCETTQVDHAKLFAIDAGNRPLASSRTLKLASENDDAPQFSSGYPVVQKNGVSVTGSAMVSVGVRSEQSCRLYWALYRHGMNYYATAKRFISGDLPGNEANGMKVLTANVPDLIDLNNLTDQTDYDLDLWLTNSDFSLASYIIRLSFTTVDGSAPTFLTPPTVTQQKDTSVTLQYSPSENVTFYWTVVESGAKFPNPPTGGGAITKNYAIQQLIAGNGGVIHGKDTARANATRTFTITKLSPEKSYDVWYVAQDTAGNYSEFRLGNPNEENDAENPRGVCMMTVATLDNKPPSFSLEATNYPEGQSDTPYADTDLRVVFSEGVRRFSTGERLTDLYDAVRTASNADARANAKEALATFLRATVTLYSGGGTIYSLAPERKSNESDWVIDYRNAKVAWEGENLVLTFPSTDDSAGDSALRLLGGKSYYFLLEDLSDLSERLNRIVSQKTNAVTTMPAQILLQELALTSANYPTGVDNVDFAFTATPLTVSRAGDNVAWDFLFWSNATCTFEVYVRSRLSTSSVYDRTWTRVQNPLGAGGQATLIHPSTASGRTGQSMHLNLCQYTSGTMPKLNSLEDERVYEYAVRFLDLEGESDRRQWNEEVNFGVTAAAGSPSTLMNLAASLTEERLTTAKASGNVQDITTPNPFDLTRRFFATVAPTFANGAPRFTPSDTSVNVWLQMTRAGKVYYVLAPEGSITTTDRNNRTVSWSRSPEIPESGADVSLTPFTLSNPLQLSVINQRFSGAGVKTGVLDIDAGGATVKIEGLQSNRNYFAYFILEGSGTYSTYVQLFRFTTLEAAPPNVGLTLKNPVVGLSVSQESLVDYVVVDRDKAILSPILGAAFWSNTPSDNHAPLSAYSDVSNVLEAMCRDTGSGSVFDVYASKLYKDTVASYIRNALKDDTTVIGFKKNVTVTPLVVETIDCSPLAMLDEHEYAVAVVAKSVNGGADVFRGIAPILPPDRNPLKITSITQNLTVDGEGTGANKTCNGTVTLNFDSELYYVNETSGTLRKVDLGPHYSVQRTDDYIPLTDITSAAFPNNMNITAGGAAQVNKSTSTISLTLNNAANKSTVTFPKEMCDEYGNTHVVTLTVTLLTNATISYYDANRNPVYSYNPEITITSAWSGIASN